MDLRKIIKDKPIDNRYLIKVIDEIEEKAGDNEELKLSVAFILSDNHMCEYTANKMIERMIPVAYLDSYGKVIPNVKCMNEYLSLLGITPEVATKHIKMAYENAKTIAREKGFAAPELNINMWDCYWALAMVLSDYWCTCNGDIEKASMIAYEYLSDPDK